MSETTITLIVAAVTALSAVITAIAAIFVPIRAAKIETKKALRLRSLDLFFEAKVKAYNQFISVTSDFFSDSTQFSKENRAKLLVIAHWACLFAESSTRTAISECAKRIELYKSDPADLPEILHLHAAALTLMRCEIDKFNFLNNQ